MASAMSCLISFEACKKIKERAFSHVFTGI
jgi:hypothetical protein